MRLKNKHNCQLKNQYTNLFYPYFFAGIMVLLGLSAHNLQAQSPMQSLVPDTAMVIYNWDDNTLPGSFFYNNTYNDVWGVAINGREYAVIGSTMGTHIFDITDIVNVSQVAFIEGALVGGDVIHRDYAEYDGHLYIVCDEGLGISTLQIVDLQLLPTAAPIIYDSNELFTMAHTVFIDTATAKMYVNIASHNNGQRYPLEVYSVENIIPQYLTTLELPDYVHDCFVRNDTAYLSTSYAGLYVYYFGNPQNPALLGALTDYPESGYNHSCWLTNDGHYLIFADENHGSPLKVADVSNLNDIEIVAQFSSGISPNSIAHNPTILGNYAYISYYHDGLQIFDISNPANPLKVAEYKTYLPTDHESYRGAWAVFPYLPSGRVLVADMQYGLYVFDVTSTDNPPTALETPTQDSANSTWNVVAANWTALDNLSIFVDKAQSGQSFSFALYNLFGQKVFEKNNLVCPNSGEVRLQIPLTNNHFSTQGLFLAQINSGQKTQNIKILCGW